jgi:hypothetical protein
MCADGAKAPAQQFGYAHAFDALARVYSEEGMRAFWKGIAPNIARSALMSEFPALCVNIANKFRCVSDRYVSLLLLRVTRLTTQIRLRQTIPRQQRFWR